MRARMLATLKIMAVVCLASSHCLAQEDSVQILDTTLSTKASAGPCDTNSCDSYLSCCNTCPCCYGYVEGLIFSRDNRSIHQPLITDDNTGNVLLDASSLNFDWSGGTRAVVGKKLCSGYTLELGYFGIFDQVASAAISGNNDLNIAGGLSSVVNNFGLADDVNLRYKSQIHSFESNLMCCRSCCDSPAWCCESAWFVGFRFLDLEETFGLTSTDLQESTTEYNVQTTNYLYGGQIGRRLRGCFGVWSWETTGKAGLFGNDAQQTSAALVDFPNFVFRPATVSSGGDVAFVGELNFTGIYHLNRTWGVRSGYNLIWIEGVALAPDQLDFTNTPTSGTAIDTSGGMLLHGASIGLEARW